jgi:hypothetical protein
MPVRNIDEDITEVWKQVNISQAPSLRSVPSPTLLPQAAHKDFTKGKKIPPALAETEGMAGARSASEKTRLYPSPREEEPKRETKRYAKRLPRPVFINPRAKKKASAISQGMGSPNAENAAEKERVLVRTEAPRPNRATAPRGRGWVIMPTMVARKMARSCHALRATPAGAGINQTRTPVRMDAARGFREAPCHGCGGAAAGPGAEDAEADAWIGVVRTDFRWRRRGKRGKWGLGVKET